MNKRTLVLRREQLVELAGEDLLDVVGAVGPESERCPDNTWICLTLPPRCDLSLRDCP